MPAVKMPFKPYFNEQFKVQVETPEEQEVCEIFADAPQDVVTEEQIYLNKLVKANPELEKERFFTFTRYVVYQRNLQFPRVPVSEIFKHLGKARTQQILAEAAARPQQQEQPVLVGPAPAGRSLLGSIFDSIMTDRLAYAKMDANKDSDALPSAQYVEAKAEATVLWDVLMGRR